MLRLTLGALFLWAHGWHKLAAGIDHWRKVGAAMHELGITFWPAFWGFMAAMAVAGSMMDWGSAVVRSVSDIRVHRKANPLI